MVYEVHFALQGRVFARVEAELGEDVVAKAQTQVLTDFGFDDPSLLSPLAVFPVPTEEEEKEKNNENKKEID